jgi:selenoprotein W-related protein
LDEFGRAIQAVTLIPSAGGVFEVTIDGELVFSKKRLGRHAEYKEIAAEVKKRLKK